jgi:tripartite-type tricarboxylate transporter receptor subunit TctC
VAVTQGILAFSPHLYSDPGYNALADFAPITRVSVGSLMLAVYPGVQAASVAQLIQLAKDKPGELTFGAAGIGTPPHMAGELFRRKAGIEVRYVPYKGGNEAHIDVIACRLTYTIEGVGILLPYVKAGKLRALAVTHSVLPPCRTFRPRSAVDARKSYLNGSGSTQKPRVLRP